MEEPVEVLDLTADADETPEEAPRKRGRPRQAQAQPEAIETPLEPIRRKAAKTAAKKRAKPDESIKVLCDVGIMGAFGLVALSTGHDHWRKSQEQVQGVTEPLAAIIDELPTKAKKALERHLNHVLLVVGAGMLVIPDAVTEANIRRSEAAARRAGFPIPGGDRVRPAYSPMPGAPGPNGAGPGVPQPADASGYVSADPRLRGLDG